MHGMMPTKGAIPLGKMKVDSVETAAKPHRSGGFELRYGSEIVDPRERSLPGLKTRWLLQNVSPQGDVLEIGSGEGKLLRSLHAHLPALKLHGCDLHDPVTPPDCYRFNRIEEGTPLPYENASFDGVIMFDVLEHVLDPAKILDEVARVLRTDGRLIAFIPVEGERFSFYRFYRRVLGDDTYRLAKDHVQAFTHQVLRELLLRRFHIERVRYAYHLLGHFMDASFFAAARAEWLRRFWFRENVFYRGKAAQSSRLSRLLNIGLRFGNAVAWAESTVLGRVEMGAAGQLIVALRLPPA
jgi:SAM-dependent methyltransferase